MTALIYRKDGPHVRRLKEAYGKLSKEEQAAEESTWDKALQAAIRRDEDEGICASANLTPASKTAPKTG